MTPWKDQFAAMSVFTFCKLLNQLAFSVLHFNALGVFKHAISFFFAYVLKRVFVAMDIYFVQFNVIFKT